MNNGHAIEMRQLVPQYTYVGEAVLQYRTIKFGIDASGAMCPMGYTDWINVTTTADTDAFHKARSAQKVSP
jgi:hypothetical protein